MKILDNRRDIYDYLCEKSKDDLVFDRRNYESYSSEYSLNDILLPERKYSLFYTDILRLPSAIDYLEETNRFGLLEIGYLQIYFEIFVKTDVGDLVPFTIYEQEYKFIDQGNYELITKEIHSVKVSKKDKLGKFPISFINYITPYGDINEILPILNNSPLAKLVSVEVIESELREYLTREGND